MTKGKTLDGIIKWITIVTFMGMVFLGSLQIMDRWSRNDTNIVNRLDQQDQRFARIEARQDKIEARQDKLEQALKDNDKASQQISMQLSEIKTDLVWIKLAIMEKEKRAQDSGKTGVKNDNTKGISISSIVSMFGFKRV